MANNLKSRQYKLNKTLGVATVALALSTSFPRGADAVIIQAGRDPQSALVSTQINPFSGVGALRGTGFCSASVISSRAILTAGHCIETRADTLDINPATYRFSLSNELGTFTSGATGVFPHPDYRPGPDSRPVSGFANDLTVITLSEPVPDYIPRYGLGSIGDPTGAAVTVVGLGFTGDGLQGKTLIDGQPRFGTNVIDRYSLGTTIVQTDFDPPRTEGFKFERGPSSEAITSQGDSGGALFYNQFRDLLANPPPPGVQIKATPDVYTLLGVTSHGLGAQYGATAGYVLVGPYISWINSVIGDVSSLFFDEPIAPAAPNGVVAEFQSIEPIFLLDAETPTNVPEPASFGLMLTLLAALSIVGFSAPFRHGGLRS